jgi:hypothetical protein
MVLDTVGDQQRLEPCLAERAPLDVGGEFEVRVGVGEQRLELGT